MQKKIQINDLEKFREAVQNIECLLAFDEIVVRHKRGNHEEAHLIADFMESEILKGYHCDIDFNHTTYRLFQFSRGGK